MDGRLRARAPGAVRGGIARDSKSVLFGGARRRRILAAVLLVLGAVVVAVLVLVVRPALSDGQTPPPARAWPAPTPALDDGNGDVVAYPRVAWKVSRAIGEPWDGELVDGVRLPAEGPDWFSWDPVYNRKPDRGWRRNGTDVLLRTLFHVLREYRAADPAAPRVGIMDLSRPHGGRFGRDFGGLGHASHQNGLDADVMYPRRDGRERRPVRPSQVDLERAQDLVDRFVEAGADKVFVGPHLALHGPEDVVIPLVNHDDHLHVRIHPPVR